MKRFISKYDVVKYSFENFHLLKLRLILQNEYFDHIIQILNFASMPQMFFINDMTHFFSRYF
jgi:hypothetical protein